MAEDPMDRRSQEMSVPEKILHVQDLWDEIVQPGDAVQLAAEQLKEAERPQPTTSWEELRSAWERLR